MKHVYLLFLLLLSVSMVHAQEAEKQKIREIKLDSTYVGNEATNGSRDSAYVEACQLLAMTINSRQWGTVTYQQLMPVVQQIHVMRGDNHRVFVYLKRADIPGTENPSAQSAEAQTAQPAVAQADTAAAAQPDTSVTDSVAVQPVDDQNTRIQIQQALEAANRYDEVLMNLLPREMFNEVKKCLEAYVKAGKLQACGMYSAKVKEPYESCYFVIVDRSLTVRAYLTPLVDGKRTNVATGQEDKLSNYAGCVAMWFR